MLCNSIVCLLVIVKGYYITVMLNKATIGVFEHNYMLVCYFVISYHES